MSNWVKWWKDKNLLAVIITALVSVVLASIPAVLFELGWIISIVLAIIGGILIRHFIGEYIKSK